MQSINAEQEMLLQALGVPFDPKEVQWRINMKSRDGKRGCFVPYADPRAYTDRLNKCVSAAGWTRTYSVTTLSPVTRMEKDKPIQTGKVIVTCIVTIEGLGSHSGTGEKWADDQNAATSAEAQAFKRACACFGLGRYFYDVPGVWVDLDEFHQPKSVPSLPAWAVPKSFASAKQPNADGQSNQQSRSSSVVAKGPLDAGVTTKIEGHRQELGHALYQSILMMVAQVGSARDIPNQQLQQSALNWIESATRGMAQVRKIAAEMPETKFYSILDKHGVQSLARVPNFGVLKKLVEDMTQAAPRSSAA